MKVFNVNEFIERNACQVVIGDKTYTVRDVPFDLKEKLENPKDLKELLADILDCPVSELEHLGITAVSATLQYLTKNLSESLSADEEKSQE